jgi:hypothetical protein
MAKESGHPFQSTDQEIVHSESHEHTDPSGGGGGGGRPRGEVYMWLEVLQLRYHKVHQHVQVNVGCDCVFNEEKLANDSIAHETTPHVNLWAIPLKLSGLMAVFGSPNPNVMSVQ